MEKKEEIMKRFKEFISSITKEDIVAVLHHTDPDGVCSGVIAAKLVEKIRGKKIDLRLNQRAGAIPVTESSLEILKQNNITKLIITDLCVDQETSNLKEIEKFAEILVIDHHKIYEDINSEKTVFIKPDFISEKKSSAYPASKFCFDLASEITDMSDFDWIAAVGLIGDCAFLTWVSFIDKVLAKYDMAKDPDIFQTDLGKGASLISDAESFDTANVEEAFNVVYTASSPNDLLNSSLQKYRDTVENEISYWKEHLNEFAEFYDDINLIFYMIKSKYRIKAPLNTRLSIENPNKTILLLQESENNTISISARRRDEKVAVNNLLENAIKGLEGASGGGHIPAAGATIKKADLQKFKENVMNILKSDENG